MSPGELPTGNVFLRTLASDKVQSKVQETPKVGPLASITIGGQVAGGQIKFNLLGAKFNIGGTVGKVEYTSELGVDGPSQSLTGTLVSGASEINTFGIVSGELNGKAGEGVILLNPDSKISTSSTAYETSGDGNVGPLNIDGEISAKVSAFGLTVGAMANPINMLESFKNFYSILETYFNQLANETMNPQNSVPDDKNK